MRAMTRLLSAMLILAGLAASVRADQMPWQPNLEAAQRLAAQTNRLVLIHFWAPWCRPCLRLDQEVFSNPETAKGLEANFVLVKLNADDAPGTARLYGVSSLPSDVITLPSGQLVSQIQSPPTSSQYVQQMNKAAAGHQALARRSNTAVAASQPVPSATMPPGTAMPVTPGAMAPAPQSALPMATEPVATTTAAAPTTPAADPYAEYYPAGQPAAAPAENPVMPAQAYASVPPTPSTAPVDPYSQPASAPPTASAPANPYAAQATPANPYETPAAPANPYAAPGAAPANPYAAAPVANPYEAPAANPYAASAPVANPYAAAPAANPSAAPAAQPPVANPYAPAPATAPPASQALFQPAAGAPQLPPGCPPVGLDGNCPVTLVERKRYAVGHPTFGVVHRGRTYLFLGPQERDKFLADPDHFSPMLSGLDPVHALDNHQQVPGKREFGVFGADGRIYLFADETTRNKFEQNEKHYSEAAAQAMQQPAYQAMRQGP